MGRMAMTARARSGPTCGIRWRASRSAMFTSIAGTADPFAATAVPPRSGNSGDSNPNSEDRKTITARNFGYCPRNSRHPDSSGAAGVPQCGRAGEGA